MKREFLVNIFFLVVINFIVKPLYIFGIDARVQNLVGPENYGVYFVLYDLIFLIQVVNDPGLQSYTSKTIAQDRKNLTSHLSGILGLKLLLGLLYFIVSIVISMVMGYHNYNLIFGISCIFFLSTLYILLRTVLSSSGYYRWDSFFSIVDKLIMLLVIGYMVWLSPDYKQFGVEMFIYSQVACYLVAIIILLGLMLRLKVITMPRFDSGAMKSVLKQSLPYSFIILLTAAYMRIDAIMIQKLLPDGYYQAGLYAASYRFVDAANMVGYLFGALLLPMYAFMIAKKESVQDLFSIAFRLLWVMSFGIMLVASFYHREIFGIFYSKEYLANSPLLSVLMMSIVPLSLSYSLGSLMQASSNIRNLNFLLIVGLIINVCLNFIFIPTYGAIAAAWNTFFTEMLLLIGLVFANMKNGLITLNLGDLAWMLISALCSIAIFFCIKEFIQIPFIFQVSLSIFVYLISMIFSKMLKINELKNLIFINK